MLNTNYITYDDVVSRQFGLCLGSFNSETGAQDTSIYSPNIAITQANKNNKFAVSNSKVDAPPEYELTLVSETTISSVMIRKIMRWLAGDGSFKKLIVNRQDLQDYYAMCVFKDISEIKVNGYCVGFKMTAVLESAFWYGQPEKVIVYNGKHTEEKVNVINKSDMAGYTYPQITFKINSGSDSIRIVNLSDDEARVFELTGLNPNTTYVIDNELHTLDGDGKISLDSFTKGLNWLRLIRGRNILKITINGEVTITCPQYSLIGF